MCRSSRKNSQFFRKLRNRERGLGSDLEYGAVCSLRNVQNPISVARLIMETPDGHNMYAHDFATKLAKEKGITFIKEEVTPPEKLDLGQNPTEFGTVGAVALQVGSEIRA